MPIEIRSPSGAIDEIVPLKRVKAPAEAGAQEVGMRGYNMGPPSASWWKMMLGMQDDAPPRRLVMIGCRSEYTDDCIPGHVDESPASIIDADSVRPDGSYTDSDGVYWYPDPPPPPVHKPNDDGYSCVWRRAT